MTARDEKPPEQPQPPRKKRRMGTDARRSSRRKLPGQTRSTSRKGMIEIECYAHKGSSCGLCGGTKKVWVAK